MTTLYELQKGFENAIMSWQSGSPICLRTNETCVAAQSAGYSIDEIRFNVASCADCPVCREQQALPTTN